MNKWIGMGRITKDIDLQTTKTGTEYCKFTVAVNRKKDKNGEQKADFVDCTAWNKTAAFVQKYFKKGDGIIVLGRFESDKYTGKDGISRTNWSVNVREVYFPTSKGKSEQTNSDVANFQNIDPSDIPF
ncbi:MAG: single-stranded DNA-binding protein [Clostridia bacterium]|nr:single-stranded DNA-binding protein [Clostridia bacterium]